MKTSDKLLLSFFLSILGLYGGMQLVLYARARDGRTTMAPKEEATWTVQYKGKVPSFLSVQGNVNVKLFPSDTFFIGYDKGDKGKIDLRESGADSLSIGGESIPMNPHDNFQRYSDYPWIEIHAGPHTRIQLTNLLALLKGPKIAGHADWDLQAVNTQLWIGEAYGNESNLTTTDYYDSVQVQATNSNLVLHWNAVIGKLNVQLDDKSELNDQHARIGQPEIHYTDRSGIKLSGINLDRLRKTP